jgi:hypothetical protein
MTSNILLLLLASIVVLFIGEFAFSDTYTLTQNTPLVFNRGTRSSVISASGIVGTITDVNVTLNGLRVNNFLQGISEHDVLLIGPHGQKIILLAYVCETFHPTSAGPFNFTFDMSASSGLPPGNQFPGVCVSGTYDPTDFAHLPPHPPLVYIFDYPPTPEPPYSKNLANLNGETGNGTWTLYAAEDGGNEGGTIDSWSLSITTDGIPVCDYEDQFNDGVLTYLQLNPSVQETGGNLVLNPTGKKAYTVSDSSFTGMQNGTFSAQIRFSDTGSGTKPKGLMVTHWVNKKNLMEIQFNVARDKVIVKQKEGTVVAKQNGVFDFDFDTTYNVDATFTGISYDVRINGTLVVSLNTVGSPQPGILGFQAKGLTQSINSVCVSP